MEKERASIFLVSLFPSHLDSGGIFGHFRVFSSDFLLQVFQLAGRIGRLQGERADMPPKWKFTIF